MTRMVTALLLLAAAMAGHPVLAEQGGAAPIYRFDPELSVAHPPVPSLSTDPNVVVSKDEDVARLRLQTESPLAPYVGAEMGQEISPEEARLLKEGGDDSGLADYKLEAGVGLFVEDRASLNLGYRFHSHPSLLDERRNDPLSLSGDLRISFDIKVPFD